MHVLRANCQVEILKRCLLCQPSVPNPKGCGWTTGDDGNLTIEWMCGPLAQNAMLELMFCKCKRSYKRPNWTCLANELDCTDMCKLQTCSNQKIVEEESDIQAELEESDNDECDEA